jgi:hypothetical protein
MKKRKEKKREKKKRKERRKLSSKISYYKSQPTNHVYSADSTSQKVFMTHIDTTMARMMSNPSK